MPKFQKKNVSPQPLEAEVIKPEEPINEGEPGERPVKAASETPEMIPKEVANKKICGIGNCTTWYDDPIIMKRHRERCHGIGIENLNKPKPRNKDVKLA